VATKHAGEGLTKAVALEFAQQLPTPNSERPEDLKGTDIENVDIRPEADFVEAVRNFLDSVSFSYCSSPLAINVAEYFDIEMVGKLLKTFNMRGADSRADYSNSERRTHGRENFDWRFYSMR
jgi:hypothetical protein